MDSQPFAIFAPHADQLHIGLFDRHDAVHTDQVAAEAIGVSSSAGLEQVHGATTVEIQQPVARTIQADGMMTQTSALALCCRAADCQNFVLYDPVHQALAVLHAGWRGLNAGAIPACLQAMQQAYQTQPADLLVGAGPSLCAHCAEFSDPTTELPNIDARHCNGRLVDLQTAADDQFFAAGVHADHLERHSDCTKCQADRWYSYRGGDKSAVLAGHCNMLVAALTTTT